MPDETKTAKTRRPHSNTGAAFEAHTHKNGILDRVDSKPQASLDKLRTMAGWARETASPPESVYKTYVCAVEFADNEHTMIHEATKLLAMYQDRYCTTLSQAFAGLPKDVGFNNGLSAPQPDMIQGAGYAFRSNHSRSRMSLAGQQPWSKMCRTPSLYPI